MMYLPVVISSVRRHVGRMSRNLLKFFSILFFCSSCNLVSSQTYFQQEVNYTINVKLDDIKHELNADETIEYINNSPHELSFIYMHLWPNAYKNNKTALAKQLFENGSTEFHNSKEFMRGYIDGLDFKVNNETVKWELDSVHIDICKVYLNKPLKSGEKIIITTPFHLKIPLGTFSRMGHIEQQYQITQWYPKPAVYDMNGWNQMPYLDQGEFYSEFGSFDVSITLPKNYVVGSTGDLAENDPERIWLDKKAEETALLTDFPKNDKFPKSDPETKTLRYRQSNVHDFAWFADKRYNVLKGIVELPHSKRNVTTWVMFTNSESTLWKNSIAYMNDAIYYYSLWNGDYPYNHATAVDGALSAGGGMEYPNVTVIGKSGSAFSLETVIMHEVGHNWFYGILGSNERKHAWMDEGINSFNELRYIETKYPDAKLFGDFAGTPPAKRLNLDFYKHKSQYELLYLFNAGKNEDQPMELPADKFTEFNYAGIVYSKSALVFDYLMAYLGEKKFDEAMQLYFERWKFKHPQPSDLRKVFEEVSGKNLSLFFDDIIKTSDKIDYKIKGFNKLADGSYDITIKNKEKINSPVSICGIKDEKLRALVWYDGFAGTQTLGFPPGDYDKFKIDFLQDIPETNRNNNTIRTSGLFKKVEPLQLQILGSLDNPDKTQLFFFPIIGWNNYDKTIAGIALYNNLAPQKKFEFVLTPMYSTNTNDVAGYGSFNYNITSLNKLFKQITLGVNTGRFTYEKTAEHDFRWNKISPEITFYFKEKDPRKKIAQSIKYRNVNILQDRLETTVNESNLPITKKDLFRYSVNVLNYTLRAKRTKNPFSVTGELQGTKEMLRASFTGNYRLSYKKVNKGIDLRLFTGRFFYNDITTTSSGHLNDYSFSLHGKSPSGNYQQDYLFDEVFLGRSETEGVLSQQMTNTEGAFKVYHPLFRSLGWMTTLNIEIAAPGKIPLKLFADFGSFQESKIHSLGAASDLSYDAGITLSLFQDFFKVYVPLFMSKDLQYYADKIANPERPLRRSELIRFQINFKMMNPFQLVKNIEL